MLVLLLYWSLLFDSFLCANIFESFQKSHSRTRSGSKPICLEQIPEGNEDVESRPGSTSPIPIEIAAFTVAGGYSNNILEACDDFLFASSPGSGFEILIKPPESSDAASESPDDLFQSCFTSTTKESLSLSSMSSLSPRIHALSLCDELAFCPQATSEKPAGIGVAEAEIEENEDSIWGATVISEVNSDAELEDDPFENVHWNQIDMKWVQEQLIPHFKQKKRFSSFLAEHIVDHTSVLLSSLDCFHKIAIKGGERLVFVGDIHGQFDDLIGIFELNGYPSIANKYIFNGDLVDRGPNSVAVVITLFSLMKAAPNSIVITRGNHETRGECGGVSTFELECREYMSDSFFRSAHHAFKALPLGAIINDRFFVCHGGLPENFRLQEFDGHNRLCLPPDLEERARLLRWNDPGDLPGMHPSLRGLNIQTFGPDVTDDFLKRHDFYLLIRSHQLVRGGYEYAHYGRLLTIFSAPNYCGSGFTAAVAIINDKLEIYFKTIV